MIGELRQAFDKSLNFVLKVVGMSHSSYYYALKPKEEKDLDTPVIQAIDEIRLTDPKYTKKYGYRRITMPFMNKVLSLITNVSFEL